MNIPADTSEPPRKRTTAAKDEILVVLLAGGDDYASAGHAAGYAEATVKKRMADPVFRGRVNDLRTVLINSAFGRMCKNARSAVDVLQRIAEDRTTNTEGQEVRLGVPYQVQTMAAKAMIENCIKTRESVSFEERLKAVEERLDAHGGI